MAVFALGDMHLSLGASKPMDIFPGWENYLPRLEANWRRLVGPEDTVVLAGDTSWAMNLKDCEKDFAFLQSLPGQKLISKGNHDYWWTTASKMNAFLQEKGFDSLHILHNNAYLVEGKLLCGTRGWLFDIGEAQDEKIMNREIGRLKASLAYADVLCPEGSPRPEKLVFLHYPPVYPNATAEGMVEALREAGITHCYYGHLHGHSIRYAVQGEVDGICYKLISADGLGFCPYHITL